MEGVFMQTCLILGVGPGLGQALAECFSRQGYHIFLVARDEVRLRAQADRIESNGSEVSIRCVDLTDDSLTDQLMEEFIRQFGAPDILIYNAFRRVAATAQDLDIDETKSLFDVNVWGAVRSVQAIYPAMKARGKGTILITGGGAAVDLWPELVPLGMSKAALRNFCLNLAETARQDGIHAATVTICGHIREGTRYDPRDIAQAYLELHRQSPDSWQSEHIFK
jgi:NADP-dependent 3-hydroxy acid dehydrogenase YdfG